MELISSSPYLTAGAILLASLLVGVIVLFTLKLVFSRIAKRTKSELDDKLLEILPTPVFRLIVLGGMFFAVEALQLTEPLNSFLERAIITVTYLVFMFLALRVMGVVTKYGFKEWAKRTHSSIDDEILPIFSKTVNAIIYIFAGILILSAWGVEIGPFLAGLGVMGIAVSFAVKDSLANIFGGVSLLLDKTFKVGDKVQLDSGEVGVIHDISLRSTRMRTYDNEVIVIPNGMLANMKLKNFVQPNEAIRVVVSFGVEYGSDPDKVKKVVLKTVKGLKETSKSQEPAVVFTQMGDFALSFETKFWVDDYTQAYDAKVKATKAIYNTLNKAKIGIPFPTQTVYLKGKGRK